MSFGGMDYAMKLFRLPLLKPAAGALVAVLVSLLAFSAAPSWSQTARTVKLVVPFPPGGAIDVLARIVAEQVGRQQGPTIVIENRPGAGTEIGTEAVVRAAPDGNTLLMGSDAMLVVPHIRKVNYDSVGDLAPICSLASVPTVIVVKTDSPLRTLDDLVKTARAKPGELTFGSAPASVLDIAFEIFAHAANFKMTFVPFPGTLPAVNAVLGGHISAAMVDYPAAAGQLLAGTLRALATGARKRIDGLPDVPTIAESGYKDYELQLWYGPFAPAKTPAETVSAFATTFVDAIRAPEIKSKLAAGLFSLDVACGADFAALLRRRSDDFGRGIREANITAK
jgi:tripartite-type tricarboxylate transporter receptor subunit TctC